MAGSMAGTGAGIEIDGVQIGVALGLMGLAIALSVWQRLQLEGNLAIATGRSIIQLLVVGYLLEAVFAFENPFFVLLAVAVMVTIATVVARNQISQKIPRLLPIVGGSIFFSTVVTLGYVNLLILRPDPWYEPQNLIPLAGILVGNVMNAATIAGDRFVSAIESSQLEIETHLSLGATRQQATMQYRRDAIRAGLLPTLNTMLIVGVVTLPGVFTGQVLGGASPLVAAGYQVLILFMLAFGSLVTAILVVNGVDRL
jgi:putative ABC transport system permease protein